MNTIGGLLRLSSKPSRAGPDQGAPGGTRWDQVGPGGERRGGTLQPTPLRQTGESRTETSRAGVAK